MGHLAPALMLLNPPSTSWDQIVYTYRRILQILAQSAIQGNLSAVGFFKRLASRTFDVVGAVTGILSTVKLFKFEKQFENIASQDF